MRFEIGSVQSVYTRSRTPTRWARSPAKCQAIAVSLYAIHSCVFFTRRPRRVIRRRHLRGPPETGWELKVCVRRCTANRQPYLTSSFGPLEFCDGTGRSGATTEYRKLQEGST